MRGRVQDPQGSRHAGSVPAATALAVEVISPDPFIYLGTQKCAGSSVWKLKGETDGGRDRATLAGSANADPANANPAGSTDAHPGGAGLHFHEPRRIPLGLPPDCI